MKTATTSKNPMEWIGVAHNDTIRYVFKKLKADPTLKKDPKTIENLIVEYFGLVGLASKPVKSKKLKEVDELIAIMQKELPLEKLLAEIDRLEKTPKILNEQDLLIFYSTAAVARHSIKLWTPTIEGGEDFGKNFGVPVMALPWIWHVAIADAKGMHESGGGLGGALHSISESVNYILTHPPY
jgi:hypothetical protein